jgi:neuronal growth regulator 1
MFSLGGSTYNGNVMKITSVRKEDRGTYYCVADNGVSRGDRRNINLEVEFSPVITIPRPRLGQVSGNFIQNPSDD